MVAPQLNPLLDTRSWWAAHASLRRANCTAPSVYSCETPCRRESSCPIFAALAPELVPRPNKRKQRVHARVERSSSSSSNDLRWFPEQRPSNEKEISHGRVSWQTH